MEICGSRYLVGNYGGRLGEDQCRRRPDVAGAIPLPQSSSGVGIYVTKDSIHHRDSDSIKVDSSDPVNGCFCKTLLCQDSFHLAHAEKIKCRDKIKISYATHLLGFGGGKDCISCQRDSLVDVLGIVHSKLYRRESVVKDEVMSLCLQASESFEVCIEET